jgi:UDP-N-acetylmuramoylalanine--D-glutamate ligase
VIVSERFVGKRITVLGAGVSGVSLARFVRKKGAQVFVTEQKNLSESTKVLFLREGILWEEGHSEQALVCDELLLSSGVSPKAPLVERALALNIKVTGELDAVAPFLRGRLVAVTGSNGKSTTVSLLGHLLREVGRNVVVAGNIGLPLGDIADVEYDDVVMELSSFQLHWAKNLALDLGIITNLDPDHLDWHGSFEKYVRAKFRLFDFLDNSGVLIGQERERALYETHGRRPTLPFAWEDAKEFERVVFFEKESCFLRQGDERTFLFDRRIVPLPGKHNAENAAMAMAAAVLLGERRECLTEALKTFRSLPHRCEIVATINGVEYVDDSKGTNVAATVTALASLEKPKIIILGGQGKGESYSKLAEAVRNYAEGAVVMGSERENICRALDEVGYRNYERAADMETALTIARSLARPGMMVLLSPACTSWDAYNNYKERGEHFRRLVQSFQIHP